MKIVNVKTNSNYNYSLLEDDLEIGSLVYNDQRLSFAIYKTEESSYYVINQSSSFFKREFKIVQNQKDLFEIKIKRNCFFTITDFQNEKIYTLDIGGIFSKGHSLSYNGEEIINVKRNFNWRKFRTEYISMTSKFNDCEDILFFITIYCETYYDLYLTG